MWGLKQKKREYKKELVQKFCRPEDLVIDSCADKLSIAKAYMLLDQDKKCAGCNVNSKVLTAAKTEPVSTF